MFVKTDLTRTQQKGTQADVKYEHNVPYLNCTPFPKTAEQFCTQCCVINPHITPPRQGLIIFLI